MNMRHILSTVLKLKPVRPVSVIRFAKMSTSDVKNAIKGNKARKERLVWVDLEVCIRNASV